MIASECGSSSKGGAISNQFSTNKAKVQFLYPFKVNRWDAFSHGIDGFLGERNDDLFTALIAAQNRLEEAFPASAGLLSKSREVIGLCLGSTGRWHSRRSNASLAAEMKKLIRELPASPHNLREVGQDLICSELTELLREQEAKTPESLMNFVCRKINVSEMPLIEHAECRLGDDKGTRAYLERKQPYVEARLRAETLVIENPKMLPDLTGRLLSHVPSQGRSGLKLSSTVRLSADGFGCLRLKVDIANEHGLNETVDEIVFTTNGDRQPPESTLRQRTALAHGLRSVIVDAVKRQDLSAVEEILSTYADSFNVNSIRRKLQRLVDRITLVSEEITTDDIVDIENLDRGFARGQEPNLYWDGSDGKEPTLHGFFRYVVEDVFLKSLREALLHDENILEFINRFDRRHSLQISDSIIREQLMSSLPNLSFHQWSLALEEHPYVSTFISAPASFKKQGVTRPSEVSEHFRSMVEKYDKDLTRILMKSKWAEIRINPESNNKPLENVFYSDLVHIAVHIRSILCLHYTPASAEEYRLLPELVQVSKYQQELNEIIQRQRILWYAYVTADHLVTSDIRSISAALDVLKEQSLREEFPEVIEGLANVIQGIDRRKMRLAETMEDPLSRKGGSSLFSEIIERTSKAFHLSTLYDTLHDKVDRLDMLGIHVNGNVQVYSNLLIQEGTRSAQLTLEFLEAFIIGFYFTELVHITNLFHGFDLFGISAGAFLTALPVITLIRRGRSRFAFENPVWLERLERFGMVVGPGLLFIMLSRAEFLEAYHSPMTTISLIGGYIIIVSSLYRWAGETVAGLLTKIKGSILRLIGRQRSHRSRKLREQRFDELASRAGDVVDSRPVAKLPKKT